MGRKWNPNEISNLEYVLVADGQCVEVVTNPKDPEGRMMLGQVRSTAEYYGDGETK